MVAEFIHKTIAHKLSFNKLLLMINTSFGAIALIMIRRGERQVLNDLNSVKKVRKATSRSGDEIRLG